MLESPYISSSESLTIRPKLARILQFPLFMPNVPQANEKDKSNQYTRAICATFTKVYKFCRQIDFQHRIENSMIQILLTLSP